MLIALGILKAFLGNIRLVTTIRECMKILICMLGIGGGGAERVLVDFFQAWEEHAKNWQETSATEGFTEGSRIIDPKQDIDLFLIEKKPQDTYLK